MNGKDYGRNIDIVDREIEKLLEQLTDMKGADEDYLKTVEAIKKLEESKLLEHRCYTEYKDNLVPSWVTPLLSIMTSVGLGVMIYQGELNGKVIGSTAVTMLNKIRFPGL